MPAWPAEHSDWQVAVVTWLHRFPDLQNFLDAAELMGRHVRVHAICRARVSGVEQGLGMPVLLGSTFIRKLATLRHWYATRA